MKKNIFFLEGLLEDQHASLGQELLKLEAALDLPPRQQTTEMLRRLTMFQARLREHFALEEEGGYLNHVLERSPQMHRVVEQLLAEHGQLAQLLAALIAAAKKTGPGTSPDPALSQQIREWIARVHQHEARENGLVQEVCNRDITAED